MADKPFKFYLSGVNLVFACKVQQSPDDLLAPVGLLDNKLQV